MKSQRFLSTVMAFTFLVVARGVARADYCISFPAFAGDFFVGRGFALPAKGKCKTFTGFALVAGGTQNNPLTGTGCVSSDGSHFNLSLFYTEPESGGATFTDSATMTLPAQTGQTVEGSSTFAIAGGKCKTSDHAIPAAEAGTASQATAAGGPGTR